jgi:hypothetical protein
LREQLSPFSREFAKLADATAFLGFSCVSWFRLPPWSPLFRCMVVMSRPGSSLQPLALSPELLLGVSHIGY